MPHCTFIKEGHVCGAPSFQDPCSACLAYARTASEKSGKPMQAPSPISVNARPSVTPANEPPRANTNPTAVAIATIHKRLHRMRQFLGPFAFDMNECDKLESDIAFLAKQLGYQWPAPPAATVPNQHHIGSEDPTPPPVTVETAPAVPPEPPAAEPAAEPAEPAAEPAPEPTTVPAPEPAATAAP